MTHHFLLLHLGIGADAEGIHDGPDIGGSLRGV